MGKRQQSENSNCSSTRVSRHANLDHPCKESECKWSPSGVRTARSHFAPRRACKALALTRGQNTHLHGRGGNRDTLVGVAKPFSLSSKVSCPHESPTHGTKEKLWQLGSLKTIPPPPPSPLQFLPPLFRSQSVHYAIWQTWILLRLNICLMAWSRISLSFSFASHGEGWKIPISINFRPIQN